MYNTVSFDLKVFICPICDRKMMTKDKGNLFPLSKDDTQIQQMKKKNVIFISNVRKDNEYICEVCKEENKGSFKCCNCEKEQPSSKLEKSIGYDTEDFLCSDCYETIPAKTWDKIIEKLEDAHKWEPY